MLLTSLTADGADDEGADTAAAAAVAAVMDGDDFFPRVLLFDVGGEFGLSIVSSRRLFVFTPPKSYDCSIFVFMCVSYPSADM